MTPGRGGETGTGSSTPTDATPAALDKKADPFTGLASLSKGRDGDGGSDIS